MARKAKATKGKLPPRPHKGICYLCGQPCYFSVETSAWRHDIVGLDHGPIPEDMHNG